MTDVRAVRTVAESRMVMEGQQNAGGLRRTDDNGKPYYDPAPLSEYPRMMYKATEREITQPHAEQIEQLKDAPMVINRFGGLLCETMIAHDADEAEVLAANGWDVTPRAAHGLTDGLAKATTAKDDEIASLKAQLAQYHTGDQGIMTPLPEGDERVDFPGGELIRRGPGRPRKNPLAPESQPE